VVSRSGTAYLRGGLAADRSRARPVDLRRHRRRPDQRHPASSTSSRRSRKDPDTDAVIMIGEIGRRRRGDRAAVDRPQLQQAGGRLHRRAAPRRRAAAMGHAGAIVSGGKGTATAKMEAMRAAASTSATRPRISAARSPAPSAAAERTRLPPRSGPQGRPSGVPPPAASCLTGARARPAGADMAHRVHELVRALDLAPHPEGGWYREVLPRRARGGSARRPAAPQRAHRRLLPARLRPARPLAPGRVRRGLDVDRGRRAAPAPVRRGDRTRLGGAARAVGEACEPVRVTPAASGRRPSRSRSTRSSPARSAPASTSPTSASSTPTRKPARSWPRRRPDLLRLD